VQPFQTVGGADETAMPGRKGEHGEPLGDVLFQPLCQVRSALLVLLDGLGQKTFRLLPIGSIEDGSDVSSHLCLHALLGHIGLGIPLQVALTALPGHTAKDGTTSIAQARVVIADDQFHTAQAAGHQALQEGAPVHLGFAQGNGDGQDLSPAFLVDTRSLEHGGISHLTVTAHLFVVGIQIQIPVTAQRAVTPGL